MTRNEIIDLLEIISATYPHGAKNIKNPEALLTAWEMVLGGFSAESVYKAARLHMETEKFFPSPSDIRENIVKADLLYQATTPNTLEAPKVDKRREDYYLKELCKFVGIGYEEPDDNADLLCEFLPYEK